MSLSICIDWGNSRVKAALFDKEGKISESFSYSASEATDSIVNLINTHSPSKGILCSVSTSSSEVEKYLKDSLRAFIKLDNNTRVPIMNAYSSPGTLGADRLALAVAGQNMFPGKNNLIISLGTCITYNFVQKNGTFRGGAISPGLHMRLKAMHHFTDMLPEVKLNGELLLLGYDTETGLRSGAVYGMTAEIDGMVTDFSSQYSDFNAILTGGDMPFFEGKVKSKIFADPDLLMKGLNIILKYNAPHIL